MTDMLSMYSFLDITKSYSAEPRFAISQDLQAMVSNLPTTGITEYSFHSQIGFGLRKAWDAHTAYTLPKCFTDWTFFGPFNTYVYKESSTLVMKVYKGEFVGADSAQHLWQTLPTTPLDLSSFEGKTVTTVNGRPWLDYYSDFANEYLSTSRDPNTRLNEAIDVSLEGGPFRWTNGLMPPNNTITLGFSDSTSQEFDMLAYYTPKEFSGNLNCTHTTSRRAANNHDKKEEADVLSQERELIPFTKLHQGDDASRRQDSLDQTSSSFTAVPLAPVCNTDGTQCYSTGMVSLSSDFTNQAVVMRVSSFSPNIADLNTESDIHVFASEFSEAATQAAAGLNNGSFTKFIIDVRGNGGGYLSLGYFADYCLTGDDGSTTGTPLSRPGRIRHNDGFDQIASICGACTWENGTSTVCRMCKAHRVGKLFLYDQWGPDTHTNHFTNGSELYCPAGGTLDAGCVGDGYLRDGSTCTQLSHRLYSQFNVSASYYSSPAASCPKSFAKNNAQLYVLSDGLCGSTCSVFVRGLQTEGYAKAIAIGGKLDTPMAVASFGGGQVWSKTVTEALPSGFEAIRAAAGVAATAQVPDGFPTFFPSAGSGIAFVPQEMGETETASGVLKFPGIPAEFIFQPADIRMYFSSASFQPATPAGLEALYQEAITKIASCSGADCDQCSGTSSAETGCGADPSIATCIATSAPTVTPTPAPTAGFNANFTITLGGISVSSFDSTAQQSFKSVVATNAGSHCGSSGSSICSALDVTISAFARRDIAVSFQLNTNSQSAATEARSTLSTYLESSQFVTDLNNEGGVLASVTSAQVTSGLAESSDDNTALIIGLCAAAGVLLLVGVSIVVYCMFFKDKDNKEALPPSPQGQPGPMPTFELSKHQADNQASAGVPPVPDEQI
jgi:hypothetical protein